MIRNLKVLLLSAMALMAFGALAASAQAAEPEFHCEVQPCRATLNLDGALGTKTAHHVFIIDKEGKSISSTCNQITGEGTSATTTFKELTITNVAYHTCEFVGQKATVVMNGCDYSFTAAGAVSIKGCTAGKSIEIQIPGCTATIPGAPANQNLKTVKYHDAAPPAEKEITVETNVTGITGTLDGTAASCGGMTPGAFTEGTYTTGNTIVTAETDPGGVQIKGWWK